MSRFKKATREQLKLRMAIDGPSGSGKTFTAILFALALGKNVAVIDTEHGSAEKYQGEVVDDLVFDFSHTNLTNFAPTEYTAAIKEGGRDGFDVIVIDSLSHAWAGEGGALELKDQKGGNNFTAWKDITPMHTRMVESILRSPAHIIATMRSKTEYVMEPDEKGRMVPRKVGMAPIQRPGMEYEFDVYGCMDWTHMIKITKSRCSAVDGAVAVKPGATFMIPIIEWLNSGVRPELAGKEAPPRREPIKTDTLNTLKDCYRDLSKAGLSAQEWRSMLLPFGVESAKELSEPNGQELLEQCIAKMSPALMLQKHLSNDPVPEAPASQEQQLNHAVMVSGNSLAKEQADVPDDSGGCSVPQAFEIDRLFGEMKFDAALVCSSIKKLYGIDCQDIGKVYYQLTAAQADDLIQRLQTKLAAQRQAN